MTTVPFTTTTATPLGAVPAPRTPPPPPEGRDGEPTAVPGLLIVADRTPDGAFTGLWTLSAPGGGRVRPTTLTYIRELATHLADFDLDWPYPTGSPASARLAREVSARFTRAQAERRPLWWARTSWLSHGPLWRVGAGDGDVASVPFADLWQLLDQLPADEAHVGFDPAPTWSLRCAAPLCDDGTGRPLQLHAQDEDGSDAGVLRHAERNVLLVEAVSARWARRGRHWMCPACTLEHLPNPGRDLRW
ncbi:hypothetical protein [Amycolatopsis australiensis]|uniref:Uncharacterized protein n=1 Tax=Amycolatopsis australiensis TaxID=546364 RepID=A0A1K1LLE0_9PSEU|nr:hypothetical protein [Amycolatopsis australiensis]SFW11663.1 hypothetical protein SAMN04489730_0045 [Amycolatopsis australiensis]